MIENYQKDEIRVLDFPKNVQARTSLYLADAPMCLREIIDNSEDVITKTGIGNTIVVSTDFHGFNLVSDNSTGIPILMSRDRPGQTQADVSISTLHSGSNFNDGAKTEVSRGVFGVGSACTQAVSEIYVLMSKVTEENYDKSLPIVREFWEGLGPRSKREIFYYVIYQGGYKSFEGVNTRVNIEKHIFGERVDLPEKMSTIVLFKIDKKYFDGNIRTQIPLDNIQNFLLIQEKFYNRRIRFIANGEVLDSSGFKPYRYEILKTITPADTSLNPYVGIYVTFEVDGSLSAKDCKGSVNGLDCSGVHISYIEQVYEAAIRGEYKINHRYVFPGLKMFVLCLVTEPVYDSQTKTRLKQIAKVKAGDFAPVIKEFTKIFRRDPEYWLSHVEKLNALAESYRSIGAVEKAQKIMDSASGNNAFRSKKDYVEGFSDATSRDRWNCSLYITEGLSAASGLKSGRKTSEYQGILPIRGKILNVKNSSIDDALANKEIFTILNVIGLGIDLNNVTTGCNSPEEAYERIKKYSRYGQICLTTDSDPDGSHIQILLLYLLSKYARFLIDFGLVYIAVGPVFIQGDKFFYPGDPVKEGTIIPVGIDESKPYQHLKGIGSCKKEDVYNAYYNPETRKLIRVTPEGLDYFMELVENVDLRKELLFEQGILGNPFNITE